MGPRDHQADERVAEITDRLSVSAWNAAEDAPAAYSADAIEDVRWLLGERQRLVGILALFTEVKH
jgi:hypothetical protein